MNKFFTKLKLYFTSGKAQAMLDQAAEIAVNPRVIEVAKTLASLTPNRTDDEIVAACEKYGLPVAQHYLATPTAKRGLVLLDIAIDVLTPLLPGVAGRVISLALNTVVAGIGS